MIVVSLSGPSGAGKTTALDRLTESLVVLPERYMERNIHNIDNTLASSKWRYIAAWIDDVFSLARRGVEVVVADRSPLDTPAYLAAGREELESVVRQTFEELEAHHNLIFRHVLVTAEYRNLKNRIDRRLAAEPQRLLYHETDDLVARGAYEYYRKRKWDAVVDSSDAAPHETAAEVLAVVGRLVKTND